jgi:hypothetical protein
MRRRVWLDRLPRTARSPRTCASPARCSSRFTATRCPATGRALNVPRVHCTSRPLRRLRHRQKVRSLMLWRLHSSRIGWSFVSASHRRRTICSSVNHFFTGLSLINRIGELAHQLATGCGSGQLFRVLTTGSVASFSKVWRTRPVRATRSAPSSASRKSAKEVSSRAAFCTQAEHRAPIAGSLTLSQRCAIRAGCRLTPPPAAAQRSEDTRHLFFTRRFSASRPRAEAILVPRAAAAPRRAGDGACPFFVIRRYRSFDHDDGDLG